MQQLVKQKFGVVAKWETLETNALLLTVQIPNAPGLSPTVKKNPPAELYGQTSYGVFDKSLTNLANFLDASLGIPVVDHTGLTNNFDFILKWNEPQQRQARGLQGLSGPMVKALNEELGLALIPSNDTPVEMLIVEKAK